MVQFYAPIGPQGSRFTARNRRAFLAVIDCEGQFMSPDGRRPHGFWCATGERFESRLVSDSLWRRRRFAGLLLDGVANGIPVVADLEAAFALGGAPLRTLIYGMAPAMVLLAQPTVPCSSAPFAAGLGLVNGLA